MRVRSLQFLQIRDSIALGDVDQRHNTDKIHHAAKSGGAYDFIMQMPKGFDTDIQATKSYWCNLEGAVDGGPLKEKVKQMESDVKISGADVLMSFALATSEGIE